MSYETSIATGTPMSDSQLIAMLRHAVATAGAYHEANLFIASIEGDTYIFKAPDVVQAEIALVEDLAPLATGGHYPTSSHIYRQAYIYRLRQISDQSQTTTAQFYRNRYIMDGHHEALLYALYQGGDATTLLSKYEHWEATQGRQSRRMAETASPRLYTEGYLQGLDTAFHMIESAEAGDYHPVAYMPDWFEQTALPQLNQLLSNRHQYDEAQAAYVILQHSEGDIWRLDRSIDRHQEWLLRVQQSGDRKMETYVGKIIAWLQQGHIIIRANP